MISFTETDMGHTELNVALSLLGYLCPPLVSVLPMTLPLTVTPPLPLAVPSSHSTPLPALSPSFSPSSSPTALPCSTLPTKPSKELSVGLVLNAGMIRIRLTENESTITHNSGNASNTSKSNSSTKNNKKVEGSYFGFSCVSCAVENTELVLIQTSHRHTQKQYVSFTADDFSLFELNEEEFRDSYRKDYGNGSSSSSSSRTIHHNKDLDNNGYSMNKAKIFPFLFGTSFHRNSSIIRDGDLASASNELALQRIILPCEYKERVVNKNIEECRQKKCPVVLFQVLMTEEKDKKEKDKKKNKNKGNDKKEKTGARDANESDVGTKSVAVCIEFSNITHKHNPQSNFIPKITRLLTPCPPSQIIKNREIEKHIINNREIKNRTISACNTNTNTNTNNETDNDNDNLNILGMQMKSQPSSPPLLLEPVKTTFITLFPDVDNCEKEEREIKDMIIVKESPVLEIVERKEKKKLQFSMTKISIRVHKLCVDYECSSTSTSIQSRMLLSLGSMALSTTIANNSNCYLLKVSVKDLVLHLSNHILRNPLFEQNPLNINGSRNMVEDTTGTGAQHNEGVIFTDGVTHSGGRQVKRFTLDFDRFLDEHDLIQVISVDDVTALVGFNPPKQSSGGLATDLGPDSYSISHHKGQEQEERQGQGGSNYNSKTEEKKGRENESENDGGTSVGATKERIDEERRKSGITQPTNSTSKNAVRVGSTDTSVELTLGLCCVYVCMDSVDVLTVSDLISLNVFSRLHCIFFSIINDPLACFFFLPSYLSSFLLFYLLFLFFFLFFSLSFFTILTLNFCSLSTCMTA